MPFRDIPNEPFLWPRRLAVMLIALCCLLLVWWLKIAGLVLAVLIGLLVFMMVRARPDEKEAEVIKSSIKLSAEDIASTLDEYDHFLFSEHPDALADRTLTRPALADKDCLEPRIEKFHYLYASNLRFLNRLDVHMARPLSVSQAEAMLTLTDQRALDLQESWIGARRAAIELGPGYRSA